MERRTFERDVATKSQLTKAKVRQLLRGLHTALAEMLRKHGVVTLTGICTIRVKTMPPRIRPAFQAKGVVSQMLRAQSRGERKKIVAKVRGPLLTHFMQ